MSLNLFVDAFWVSPYAFSSFVTLGEKRIAFDTRPVALQSAEQHRPEYRDRTFTGRVPALEHNGFWLAESSAIIEYLDDAFPDTLRALPVDLQQRARARQVMAWLRSDLLALREERPTTSMFYQRADRPLSPAGQQAAAKLVHVAGLLIPDGAKALFSGWSAADADLAFMLHRLILNGHDVPAKVRAFAEAQWARPSVRAWVERDRIPCLPY
jgi:glutathione S-transferase